MSTTVTATSVPETKRSTSAASPYEKHDTIADGSSSGLSTVVQPSAEPPRAGLTMSGRPRCPTTRSSTAAAPSSRKAACGSTTDAGVVSPARVASALAVGLSHAMRQAGGVEPT